MYDALIFFATFVTAVVVIQLTAPIAVKVGLVDRPGGHKLHEDHVPLVGGFALYMGLFLAWFLGPRIGLGSINSIFVAASGLLFTIGLVDDRFQLSVRLRMAMQVVAALLLVYSNAELRDLGELIPGTSLELGVLSTPFTIFAVVGTINAMNMIDGVDGLAGLVAFAILLLLLFVSYVSQSNVQLLIVLCMLGAVGGFLYFNMRRKGRDRAAVFMGDAGSTILGFLFAYLFISLSQGENRAISPVVAVWLFAVPLMDTVGVMIRRIWLGRSPFSPDRGHLHHLLIDAGFRMRHAVLVIAALQLALGTLGLAAYYLGVPDYLSLALFLGGFLLYAYFISRPWRAVPRIRTFHRGLDLTVRGARQVFVGNLARDTAFAEVKNLLREAGEQRPFELYERTDPESGDTTVFALVDAGETDNVNRLARKLRSARRRLYARHRPGQDEMVIRQLVPRDAANDRRRASNGNAATEQRRRERRVASRRLENRSYA